MRSISTHERGSAGLLWCYRRGKGCSAGDTNAPCPARASQTTGFLNHRMRPAALRSLAEAVTFGCSADVGGCIFPTIVKRAVIGFNRRSFLALAATVAHPAIAVPAPSSFDVIVVGAGAAGIAAGRRFAAAGRRLAVLEASDRVGGRCSPTCTRSAYRMTAARVGSMRKR
jgi:NAD(P)-binding Rossmann-like domain